MLAHTANTELPPLRADRQDHRRATDTGGQPLPSAGEGRAHSDAAIDKETILIFRIGSLGDTVVALPSFHRIARSFPNARRLVIADIPASQKAAAVASVLENSGLIDEAIYYPAAIKSFRDLLHLRSRIKATKADTLIYLTDRDLLRTVRDYWFFRLCGIRRIIGAPFTFDLRHARIDGKSGETEMESLRLGRCIAGLGAIDISDPAQWDLRLQPEEMRAARVFLEPIKGLQFVAISMGGKVESKDWGNDNWSALLKLMAVDHSPLALVFIGSSDEADRADVVAAAWPGRTLNLCGRLTPRESAAAMKDAISFVGHDSGPMHLAAAVGVPCVCMFGNFNVPRAWYPLGPGHRIVHDMRGVRNITPQQIYAAFQASVAARLGR